MMEGFFNITKLPQICTARDGFHIKLANEPKQAYMLVDYWCQHDACTILLQKNCDHDNNFLNVCVHAFGGSHNATHLRKYSFYKKLMENAIL